MRYNLYNLNANLLELIINYLLEYEKLQLIKVCSYNNINLTNQLL